MTSTSAAPRETSFDLTLAFFKSLGNESRLRIVALLFERPYQVKELAAALKLKEPTVCHHLGRLAKLGLVEMAPKGNAHYYSLRDQELRRIGRTIFAKRPIAVAPSAQDWAGRVLANYLDGERLKTIPASRRKRWAVLKWLAEKFASGKRYPEAEVNALIQRHHWDSATLRRELIGYRMLGRSAGLYWRQPEAEWLKAAS